MLDFSETNAYIEDNAHEARRIINMGVDSGLAALLDFKSSVRR